MHNPVRVDSRRGLKRSWVSSEQQPGPSSSSVAKDKPTSAEKGKAPWQTYKRDNPVKTILKVVVSRKYSARKLYIVKKSMILVFSHLAGTYYMN